MQLSTLVTSFSLFTLLAAHYLNLPLHKYTDDFEVLNKRGTSNGSVFINSQASAYFVNITIGTPPQTVQLVLDTGSPLTWVNAQNVSAFTPGKTSALQTGNAGAICSVNSCLAPDASTSINVHSSSVIFDIQYVDGTESIGRTVEDSIVFQGLTDSTFEFGLVEYFYSPQGSSSSLGGVLGLSPPNPVLTFETLTAALASTTSTCYFIPQTILQQLESAGAISNTAFSLYLSDGSVGQLTIGGVDSGRYSGPLTVVPITKDTAQAGSSYCVNLNFVGFNASTSNKISVTNVVVLDSGTTSMYLPAAVVQQLATSLSGIFVPYDTSSGLLGIPCSTSTTIDFYFDNSAVIKVPTNDILSSRLSAAQAKKNGLTGVTGDICLLSLFGTSDNQTYLLGDAFLRSTYVVFDTAESQVAIAQAAYNGPSNILAMNSGQFGIPGGVYNSSSPGASNVAIVPTQTSTLALASGAGIRTTTGGATITFSSISSTTAAKTTEGAATESFAIRNVPTSVYRWISVAVVLLTCRAMLSI